jgi:hypothetical protein
MLRIMKRTLVRHANQYFAGSTGILGANPSSELLAQVGYFHYFASGRSVNGFTAGYIDSPSRIAPIWNQWFEEVITYNPATGRMTVSVNAAPLFRSAESRPLIRSESACMPTDGDGSFPYGQRYSA